MHLKKIIDRRSGWFTYQSRKLVDKNYKLNRKKKDLLRFKFKYHGERMKENFVMEKGIEKKRWHLLPSENFHRDRGNFRVGNKFQNKIDEP